VSSGIPIIAGILLRPLSLFFLFAFTGFALLLPETLTEHILFYGVILSFLINGAGHWRVPQARDKAAEIVIIGGGFSGVSCRDENRKAHWALLPSPCHINPR
jgi:hypothetical protein